MTNEKAMKWIKDHYYPDDWVCDYDTTAMRLAVDALKKQIPKKPIRANRAVCKNGSICMLDENEFWKCPNNHGAYDVPLKENQKFCHECGQAIDWSK